MFIGAAPRMVRHAYVLLVVMIGWVFFRAETLPRGLQYLATLVDPVRAPSDPRLSILLNAQPLTALLAGSVFAVPALPWLLDRLRTPRAELAVAGVPAQLDTRGVHALPIPMLAAGFVISVALLAGSTLNPFLYFRF